MNNISKYPDDDMVVIEGPSPQKMREEESALEHHFRYMTDPRDMFEPGTFFIEIDGEGNQEMRQTKTIGELEKETLEKIDRQQIKYHADELSQCQRCKVYHNDPKHNCASVALVKIIETPQNWTWIWDISFRIQTFIL